MKKKIQEILKSKSIEFSKELQNNFKKIKGISVSGSVSSGYADEYSDIDIDIWLSNRNYKEWAKHCPLMGKYKNFIKQETSSNYTITIDGTKYDVSLFSIEKSRRDIWRLEQIERRQNSIILFDTAGTVKNILKDKISISRGYQLSSKEVDSKLSNNFYPFFINAYLNYFTPIAIKRQQFIQAHLDLNFAIYLLLEYVCVKNNRFFPDTKSKWNVASAFLKPSIIIKFKKAQLIKSYDEEEIHRRRKLLNEISSYLEIKKIVFFNPNISIEEH